MKRLPAARLPAAALSAVLLPPPSPLLRPLAQPSVRRVSPCISLSPPRHSMGAWAVRSDTAARDRTRWQDGASTSRVWSIADRACCSSSRTKPPARGNKADGDPTTGTISQRLKEVLKLYGITATVFHTSVYACCFATIYTAIRTGLDTAELLHSWGLAVQIPQGAGDLVAAWCIAAVTGPARVVATITCAPVLARWWDRKRTKQTA